MDDALLHDDNQVADAHCFFLVVRNEDGCNAGLPLNPGKFFPSLQAKTRIKVRKRLVKKQHARRLHKGAGDGDTLLLTAGELVGLSFHQCINLHEFCRFKSALVHLLLRELILAAQVS